MKRNSECHTESVSASPPKYNGILKSPPSGGILSEAGQVQDDREILKLVNI